jgi:hypothetical protein
MKTFGSSKVFENSIWMFFDFDHLKTLELKAFQFLNLENLRKQR